MMAQNHWGEFCLSILITTFNWMKYLARISLLQSELKNMDKTKPTKRECNIFDYQKHWIEKKLSFATQTMDLTFWIFRGCFLRT